MKIGVFVGSFDPVHKGHTDIMNYLVDKKMVDKVKEILNSKEKKEISLDIEELQKRRMEKLESIFDGGDF